MSSTSSRPIAFNLVRLIMSSIHTTPRGVDRIDFGYLSHLLEHWPNDVVGVMPTLIGFRCFERDMLVRGRDRLVGMWQEDIDAEHDPALARLIARFANPDMPDPPGKPRRHLPDWQGLQRMRDLVLAEGIRFGKPARDMPHNAIYLDIGHFGLTFPGTFGWRKARPDVTPVFLIHDAIPAQFPQMVAPDTVASYSKLLDVVARHARALITPTEAAGEAIRDALSRRGAVPPPSMANPLPIAETFLTPQAGLPALAQTPYFVMCGAVEPRKNHALLIEVWRRLVESRGDEAPHLVIAGSRGFRSAEILAPLAQEPGLGARVILAEGLATPALARLIAGARALLMPSFAEGFGLPPVEALALGTPALLSDIGAHREASGVFGTFLPVEDAEAWHQAIIRLLEPAAFAAEKARIAPFRATLWDEHMARTGAFLDGLAPG